MRHNEAREDVLFPTRALRLCRWFADLTERD